MVRTMMLAVLLVGCDGGTADDTSPVDDTSTEAATWTADIQPILAQHCAGCHSDPCSTTICWLEDYDVVSGAAGNPDCGGKTIAECIPQRIADGSMPAGGGCLPGDAGCITADNVAIIEAWVAAGFPQ